MPYDMVLTTDVITLAILLVKTFENKFWCERKPLTILFFFFLKGLFYLTWETFSFERLFY